MDGRHRKRHPLWPVIRAHRRAFAAAICLTTAACALAMVQPVTLNWLVASVSHQQSLALPVLVMILVTVGESAMRGVQAYLIHRTSEAVVRTLRTTLVGRLLRLPISTYERYSRGDLVARLSADTTLVRQVLTSGVMDMISCALLIVGSMAMMIILDPWLALLTAIGVAFTCLAVVPIASATKRSGLSYQDDLGTLASIFDAALSSIRLVRSYGGEEQQERRLHARAEAVFRHGLRLARQQAMVEPIFGIATQGAFLAVLAIGGARVASESLSVGALVSFLLYLLMAIMPISQLLTAMTTIQTGFAALERIEDIAALPTEVEPVRCDVPPVDGAPAFQLNDVTFEYLPGRGVFDVDLTIPSGLHTAIVGPSGAGKSTLLNLLERFYTPTSGTIEYRGRDLQSLDQVNYRREVHFLEQNVPGLAGTLGDNLRLANPTAGDAELLDALVDVGLGHLVTDNALTRELHDLGSSLSGGEKQRLGWARLRLSCRSVLLLDEPTSNVDPVSEAHFARLLTSISGERTIITVAHRLSTIRHADQIVVVHEGRVLAVGDHRELLGGCELYHDMARRQQAA